MADIENRLMVTDLHDRMSRYKSFYASYEDSFPHVALKYPWTERKEFGNTC
jgi:hypothetical protein